MRGVLAKLVHGCISRREFASRLTRLGFGSLAIESILDTIPDARANRLTDQSESREGFRVAPFSEKTPYEQWIESQGVPVHRGYHIPDVRALEVRPWQRLGVRGALIDLEGAEGTDGAYVCELAPGASTKPQRYMFEEAIFVLDGEGETAIWHEGGAKQTFKWQKGSLYSPPLNVWRQHINRGRAPARLLSVNDAPLVMDVFHNAEFIFNNNFVFRDRFNNQPDYFVFNQSKLHAGGSAAIFGEGERGIVNMVDAGLIPDVNRLELYEAKSRGLKNKSVEIILSDNTLQTHLSEFEVGTYKRAHRHGPGSHVLILGGVGYTLMWTDVPHFTTAPKKVRVDWTDGTLLVPPDRWFHQHFNTGATQAKYMATTWVGGKFFAKAMGGGGRTHRLNTVSFREGGNMIDYPDEDAAVRAMFDEELGKHGMKTRMPASSK